MYQNSLKYLLTRGINMVDSELGVHKQALVTTGFHFSVSKNGAQMWHSLALTLRTSCSISLQRNNPSYDLWVKKWRVAVNPYLSPSCLPSNLEFLSTELFQDSGRKITLDSCPHCVYSSQHLPLSTSLH